ncbi:uncharacterized protein LOC132028153 [Mustela nigripes]|uniref:uncharacterized protein LOC132028153 n=1 Tax=Mustela nigripes TaxID=77151 RepID=UPI0028156F52|nr:uncharacterized protein LOC132028153 [Mustela nigripes]
MGPPGVLPDPWPCTRVPRSPASFPFPSSASAFPCKTRSHPERPAAPTACWGIWGLSSGCPAPPVPPALSRWAEHPAPARNLTNSRVLPSASGRGPVSCRQRELCPELRSPSSPSAFARPAPAPSHRHPHPGHPSRLLLCVSSSHGQPAGDACCTCRGGRCIFRDREVFSAHSFVRLGSHPHPQGSPPTVLPPWRLRPSGSGWLAPGWDLRSFLRVTGSRPDGLKRMTTPSVDARLLPGVPRSHEAENKPHGVVCVARSVPAGPAVPRQWENRADPRSHARVSAGAAQSRASRAPLLWWEVLLRRARESGLPRRTGCGDGPLTRRWGGRVPSPSLVGTLSQGPRRPQDTGPWGAAPAAHNIPHPPSTGREARGP